MGHQVRMALTRRACTRCPVPLPLVGSIPGRVQIEHSDTNSHRCDTFLELCCPDAKPRRWAPPLVTRYGVITRVAYILKVCLLSMLVAIQLQPI